MRIDDPASPWGKKFGWYLQHICDEIATTDGKNQRITGLVASGNALVYIDQAYSNAGCTDRIIPTALSCTCRGTQQSTRALQTTQVSTLRCSRLHPSSRRCLSSVTFRSGRLALKSISGACECRRTARREDLTSRQEPLAGHLQPFSREGFSDVT